MRSQIRSGTGSDVRIVASPGSHDPPGTVYRTRRRPHRRAVLGIAAVLFTLASLAAGGLALASAGAQPAASVRPSASAAAAPPAPALVPDTARPAAGAVPVSVSVPAIGVSSTLEQLHVDPDGSLEVPANPARAGWFADGGVPGEVGPAVIAGHVDSYRGPGVFFRLRLLKKGSVVQVKLSDGSTVRFRVTAVRHYPKTTFPTQAVYGPTAGAELRLITCGGKFDRSERSYKDNVVAFAELI